MKSAEKAGAVAVPAARDLRALINRRRMELGLSIRALASGLDLSPGAVGHWVVGRRIPLTSEVPALAGVLQVNAEELRALIRAARRTRREAHPAAADRRRGRRKHAASLDPALIAMIEATTEQLAHAVVVLDSTGNVLAANARAQAVGAQPLRSLRWRALWRAWGRARDASGRVVSAARSPLARSLRGGEPVENCHIRFTDSEGKSTNVSFTVTPVFSANQLVGAIARWRNVEPKRQRRKRPQRRSVGRRSRR